MTGLSSTYHGVATRLEGMDWLIPTLARFLFAAILLVYFLNAGMTKLRDGISGLWSPTSAYAQIFPRAFDAAGYDTDAMSIWHWLVAITGTWTEFVLPALIVLGFLTRIASLGMIGFVALQSLTDVYGFGRLDEIGAWFDRFPDSAIMDQRGLWIFLLLVLVIKGAGPLSFDRALCPRQ